MMLLGEHSHCELKRLCDDLREEIGKCKGTLNQELDSYVLEVYDSLRELSCKACSSDELEIIDKINLNSMFFINSLDWSSDAKTELQSKLNSFIAKATEYSKNGEIMLQSWRVFSIALYTMAQGNLVQAASLLDTCLKLACFNYVTDGNTKNCQNGMILFFTQKKKPSKDRVDNQENTNYTFSDVIHKLCDFPKDCAKLDGKDVSSEDKSSDVGWFPCYSVLENMRSGLSREFFKNAVGYFADKVKSDYDKHKIEHFKLPLNCPENVNVYWKACNAGKDKCLKLKDNNGLWLHICKPCNLNYDDSDPLGELEKNVRKSRNALAHGNLKQFDANEKGQKDKARNHFYHDREYIISCCSKLFVDVYSFLKFLTRDLYFEEDGKEYKGMDLVLHCTSFLRKAESVDTLEKLHSKEMKKISVVSAGNLSDNEEQENCSIPANSSDGFD